MRRGALGLLAATWAAAALGEEPPRDQVLAELIDQALARRPELTQARAEERAAQERVPQAQALAEPMLQIGVQNDSFTRWQVGRAETSWVSFMATQTFPFPGTTALRGALAGDEVRQRALAVERVRLSTIAEVRREYLGLQLARARLELLERRKALLEAAVAAAQARYEALEGQQADVLRARVELKRLAQQRLAAEAAARLQQHELNRLRGTPLGLRIETAVPLTALEFPEPPTEASALERFAALSPEALAAGAELTRAEHGQRLAERSYWPDLTVSAGVMVRGSLDPMWTVSVGVPLPVFGPLKQSRAIAEASALADSATAARQALDQRALLRIGHRVETWKALRDSWRAFHDGLLADAAAAAQATLDQYRVGKLPLASVLEADAASIAVIDDSYAVLAEGWRLAIADDELSLAETPTSAGKMP